MPPRHRFAILALVVMTVAVAVWFARGGPGRMRRPLAMAVARDRARLAGEARSGPGAPSEPSWTAADLREVREGLLEHGREPPDARLDALVESIRARHPGERGRSLEGLARSWWVYREDLRAAEASWGTIDPGERFARTARLRREAFGEALAASLFGPEERRVALALATERVVGEPGLEGEELERRREELALSILADAVPGFDGDGLDGDPLDHEGLEPGALDPGALDRDAPAGSDRPRGEGRPPAGRTPGPAAPGALPPAP